MFPLMVYSNESYADISFKLYNELEDSYLDIDDVLHFSEDMHLGNGLNPVILHAESEQPQEILVSMPYPNPFNPTVNIDVNLMTQNNVNIKIYNIKGQLVDNLYSGLLNQGLSKISWNSGYQPSGVYFVNVESNGIIIANHKIMLLK